MTELKPINNSFSSQSEHSRSGLSRAEFSRSEFSRAEVKRPFDLPFQWLGEVAYAQAVELQQRQVKGFFTEALSGAEIRPQQSVQGVVFGCEHPATITLGVSASAADVIAPGDHFAVWRSERGGKATVHSPGQLLIYPICRIQGIGVSRYAEALLSITYATLTKLGVHSLETRLGAGLFVGDAKVGFMGLKVQRGIVSHGLAINVCNDLSLFKAIVSCGVQSQPMTSLAEMGVVIAPVELFWLWQESWVQHWTSLEPRQ